MRTFVVELGTGVDLHGQDGTKAAVRDHLARSAPIQSA